MRERKWCRHANRWGASRWARGYFAAISRLGDGVFWYLLMGALVPPRRRFIQTHAKEVRNLDV